MQSSLISKIQKAKRYAEERDRVTFSDLQLSFRGDHDTYNVKFANGSWSCGCHFFSTWGTCSHTMAMQRILGAMLPPQEIPAPEPIPAEAEATN